MTEWYYANGGERRGPVDQADFDDLIRRSIIRPETLIWTEGMTDWRPAGEELQGMVPSGPPRMAGETAAEAGVGAYGGARPMGFVEAIRDGFARYVDFKGRAMRSQFWWFYLAWVIGYLVTTALDFAVLGMPENGAFNGIFFLATFLPLLAVMVRRLHDIGKTGWWVLICLIPIVGSIVLIVWFCQKSDQGHNKWG